MSNQITTIMNKTTVDVYRCNTTMGGVTYDCTNGGVTSRHDSFTFFWNCKVEDAIKYCEENNLDKDSCLILVKRELWGEDHSYAAPLFRPKNTIGPMFGGNFIYTCDDNFYKLHGLTTGSPIQVHDRFESQKEYDALSI